MDPTARVRLNLTSASPYNRGGIWFGAAGHFNVMRNFFKLTDKIFTIYID